MARPRLGDRNGVRVRLPVELDEWLERTARPGGPDSYCPMGRTKNELIVKAVYVLRELLDGVPSPASAELMDVVLDRIPISNHDQGGDGRWI